MEHESEWSCLIRMLYTPDKYILNETVTTEIKTSVQVTYRVWLI